MENLITQFDSAQETIWEKDMLLCKVVTVTYSED